MSTPATEITVLTLKPDALVEDVSTQHGQIFSQLLKTVSSQAGFQRQYWGRQLENPNHLVLSVGEIEISNTYIPLCIPHTPAPPTPTRRDEEIVTLYNLLTRFPLSLCLDQSRLG